MEMNRGDGSMGTFLGVHGGLAMKSIFMLGSEEQKRKWLPPMARLEKIGAFALTEPDHGSDSVALETSARRDGDSWVSTAEAVDRQRHHRRCRRGLGPRHRRRPGQGIPRRERHAGLRRQQIERKVSLRAVWQAEIALDELRVPARTGCPGRTRSRHRHDARRHPHHVRVGARSGTPIGRLRRRLTYATERDQFGKPLAGFQIVQQRLVKMLADVTRCSCTACRWRRLAEQGRLSDTLAGLARCTTRRKAREVSPTRGTCWAATESCSTTT